jgi:hypothetical protein
MRGLEFSSHREESRRAADRRLTGVPASRALLGDMPSRSVTIAAVNDPDPINRKVALVSIRQRLDDLFQGHARKVGEGIQVGGCAPGGRYLCLLCGGRPVRTPDLQGP